MPHTPQDALLAAVLRALDAERDESGKIIDPDPVRADIEKIIAHGTAAKHEEASSQVSIFTGRTPSQGGTIPKFAEEDAQAAQHLGNFYAHLLDSLELAGKNVDLMADALSNDIQEYGYRLTRGKDGWTAEQGTYEEYVEPGYTGESKDRRGYRICYKDGKRVACGHRDKGVMSAQRVAARKARTPDLGGLDNRLKVHAASHPINRHEKHRAGLALNLLKRHHGELAAHRLEELADHLEKALVAVPEQRKGMVSKQLAMLHAMIGMVGEKAKTSPADTGRGGTDDGGLTKKPEVSSSHTFGNLVKWVGTGGRQVSGIIRSVEDNHARVFVPSPGGGGTVTQVPLTALTVVSGSGFPFGSHGLGFLRDIIKDSSTKGGISKAAWNLVDEIDRDNVKMDLKTEMFIRNGEPEHVFAMLKHVARTGQSHNGGEVRRAATEWLSGDGYQSFLVDAKFTGTDSLGREWHNGKLVAKAEETKADQGDRSAAEPSKIREPEKQVTPSWKKAIKRDWQTALRNYAMTRVSGKPVNETQEEYNAKKTFGDKLDAVRRHRVNGLVALGLRELKKLATVEGIDVDDVQKKTILVPVHAIAHAIDHKRQVKAALTAGKPVPPEVLADYPDLAAKYQKKPEDAPGFTGTDSLGREWRDGKLVAKGEEPGQGKPSPVPEPPEAIDTRMKSLDPRAYAEALKAMSPQDRQAYLERKKAAAVAAHQGEEKPQSITIPDGFYAVVGDKKRYAGETVPAGTTLLKVETDSGQRTDGRRAELGGTDGANAGGTAPAGVKPPNERIVTARKGLTKPADPELVPASLRQHLDDHQVQGVAKSIEALDAHGGFLLADGTGVGKTRQLLAVAKRYADQGKKVLIVTKAEVIKPNWAKGQVSGSFDADSKTMGIGLDLTRGDKPIEGGRVALSTYDNLKHLKDKIDKNTIVLFDESHSLKNWSSQRAKDGYEMSKAAGAVMYATATPADKPLHIAHLFRAKIFGDRKWEETYTELGMRQVEIRTPQGTIKKWEINPRVGAAEVYRRMAGLFDRLTEDGLMLKREISFDGVDVGFDKVELPQEAHDAMERIARTIAQSSGGNSGLKQALTLMHQRRQQEPYKIPHVVESVKRELAEGRQVVVFASRVSESEVKDAEDNTVAKSEGTAGAVRKALEAAGVSANDVVELHGQITPTKRRQAMQDFQAGKGKVIIATVESGGTGINLDDVAGDKPRTMIMMTAPFSAVENVQAAGRVWRLKTKSLPRVRYVFGNTDVDHWNASLIAGKMKTLGAAVQGEVAKLDIPDLDVSEDEEAERLAALKSQSATPQEAYKWKPLVRPKQPQEATGSASQSVSSTAVRPKVSTRQVNTQRGARTVHSYPTPRAFWDIWKTNKSRLPSNVSVGKDNRTGEWEVVIWGADEDDVHQSLGKLSSLGVAPHYKTGDSAKFSEPLADLLSALSPAGYRSVLLSLPADTRRAYLSHKRQSAVRKFAESRRS